MNTLDVIVVVSTACGAGTVIGAFALLYRGGLKLGGTAPGGVFSLELFDKIRIGTSMPLLGLLVVALLFFGLSAYVAATTPVVAIRLVGTTTESYPGLRVLVADAGEYPIAVAGTDLQGVVRPSLDTLAVVYTAPGYVAQTRFLPLAHQRGGTIRLDPIRLERGDSRYAPSNDANASPAPQPGFAPLEQASFGRGSPP